MRIDSHVCYSPAHPPEHLQAILARNKFEGALLVVDGAPFPETGPHILGLIARGPAALHLDASPKVRAVCAPFNSGTLDLAHELLRRNLAFDADIRPAELPALLPLARRFPDLRIAIDHLARPQYADGITDEWRRTIDAAARLPNVYCKLSGLLTEITLPWNAAILRPFVQHALSAFGPRRLMFGSEWPVRLPDITWKEALAAFTQSIGANPIEVREQLLGGTAAEFYGL